METTSFVVERNNGVRGRVLVRSFERNFLRANMDGTPPNQYPTTVAVYRDPLRSSSKVERQQQQVDPRKREKKKIQNLVFDDIERK